MRKSRADSESEGVGAHGSWALYDQAAVSAANFLTIALGAWLLPLPEQAKLVYLYTAYVALVLTNTAALFAAAPIMRYRVANAPAYRGQLLRAQLALAGGGALLVAALFILFGTGLGWTPTLSELAGLLVFLVLQQLADFARRAEYVFGRTGLAALVSIPGLGLRIGAILLIQPTEARTLFFLLALSALPGAVTSLLRGRGGARATDERDILLQHGRIARWNMAATPLRWCGLHLPILLVGFLAGPGPAAILASVRSMSTIANVFLELLESYVPSRMAARVHREGVAALRKVAIRLYAWGAGIWLLLLFLIGGFGEPLLGLALGPTYAGHRDILLLLWVGNGLFFLGRLAGVQHRVGGRPRVELVGALAALPALLAGYLLISAYGELGGAWTLLLVQLSTVVAQLVWVRSFKIGEEP